MIDPPFQWQIVRVDLNPVRGSEQAGIRPAVIVSRESINLPLTVLSIIPMTTNRAGRRIHSSEVLLPSRKTGLPNDSVAMAQQIRTISKERILLAYGIVADEDLRAKVRQAIKVYLDLDE